MAENVSGGIVLPDVQMGVIGHQQEPLSVLLMVSDGVDVSKLWKDLRTDGWLGALHRKSQRVHWHQGQLTAAVGYLQTQKFILKSVIIGKIQNA